MKYSILTLITIFSSMAFGQSGALGKYMSDLKSEKRLVIHEVMELSKQDSLTFWMIYDEFEQENDKIMDQQMNMIKGYMASYKKMTNEIAADLINNSFDLRQRQLDLEKSYSTKFQEFLSASQVAKFIQINNRINMTFDIQLSELIPYIKTISDL